MEININNNINLDLEERSEPWARRCLDGLCGHVGDVLCDGWHESVEEDRLITPEEYNELAPSIAEEFIKRWLAKMGDGMCNRMIAEILRADAKHLEKAWKETSPEFKKHTNAHYRKQWDALKAKAVTA